MSVKYCKPENEFHIPLLGGDKGLPVRSRFGEGRGGSIKKDTHFSGLQYFTSSSNKIL